MALKAFENKAPSINISLLGNRSDEFSSLVHIHNDMQILVGSSGILEVIYKSKKHNLRVGDVIIINRFTPHISHAILPFTSALSIHIPTKELFYSQTHHISQNLEIALTESQNDFIYLRREDEITSELVSIITKTNEESSKKDKSHTLFTEGYTKILLGLLTRHNIIPDALQRCDQKAIEKLARAFEYIDDHLSQEISLEEIADTVGMNREYFCRLFKKAVNMTFVDYTNLARINCAKKMLIASEESICDISDSLGFSSVSYFTRVFKSITELTPASYRNIKLF